MKRKQSVILSGFIALLLSLQGCGGGSSPERAAGNANRAPIAVNDVALQNGAAINIAILSNDRDPDGDSLSLATVGAAANGTTAINDNGTADGADDFVTYTPNAGYGGNDSFTYSISDRFGLSASATVSVVATSTAPVANSDDASTAADTPVSIFVLANDSDPNGLTLNLVSVTAPANGLASINDNGTPADASDDYVDYGPNSGFSGSDSFSYTINNGAESASASVNVIVGGSGSEGVSGDVTKGPISGAVIKLYRIDGQGMPVGAAVAQTATNAQGKWTVAVPLPREPLLVVSEGGQYIDETDSNPDISQRRVIQLDAADQLEAVMPAADDYLSLNLYTNAMLLKSRAETVGNEFSQVYSVNRSLMTQAAGFDPVTTAPTDPGNPNPAASDASKQYALLLGGAANALNAVIQPTSQNAVAFNVLGGFITDMTDCRLDGSNQDGPAQYLFLGAQRNMPSDINLNLEITRFRNNNFSRYGGITASIDQDICSQSGAVPDTLAPVITLLGANPLTFEGGGVYTDAGFTAVDDRDGDVTASVTVTGSINTTVTGTQTLTYSVSDSAGNVGTATRTVNVVDTTPPVLTLNGTTPVTVLLNTSYTDSLGANALDAVDGDISAAIVSVNPVDINTPGSYTITYDVTDDAGNAATQITRVVDVVDTLDPVITLNGNSPQTHEAGTPYVDAGATANDAPDGDITASIVTVNNVNSSAVGSYTVTYDVTDSSGNAAATVTRIVNVTDSTLPVITLAGANPQIIEAPAAYTESGATASDSFDGDLTASIVIDASAVDTSTPGSYVVTYDVSDANGNAAITVSRTVTVQDTSAPVITLAGANPQTLEAGSPYTELGASASDTLDGDLTASVVIDTTAVDPATPGSYIVTYDVSDAAGNAATQVTRTVNVVDTTPPVITLAGANPQTVEATTAYTELGATASDSVDGDITASIVIDVSAVDTSTPGSYVVTYDVMDAAGNAATQITRTVSVVDTTPPVITLTGANPQTIEATTAYTELGATASDTLDGDVSASIVIDASAVDTSTPGSYVVTYDVMDGAGNAATQFTRTVTVQDTTPPVITLTGANPQTIEATTAYTELGATASDSVDGDITASIVIDVSAVDTSTPGSYIVTYDVSDAAGNAATPVTRTVNVVDTTPPIITLTGANPQTLEATTAYTELGATASDNLDGDISGSLVIDASAVDTGTPGSYVVTYDVMDAAGNAATQVTRTVNVSDTTAPLITLVGADPLTHEAATPFTDPGATASDTLDGDISGSIVSGGSVDVNVPGSYVLTYDVTDAAGNAATQVTRTVNVVDTTPPVISLNGFDPLNVVQDSVYADPGATASDSLDGDVSASLVIDDSAVDTSTLGTYIVNFTASDGTGNVGTNTRTVNVLADTGYVSSTNPADGATIVPVDANIEVVFNQPMNAATITDTHLVVSEFSNGSPAIAAVVSWNAGTLTATIDPVADLGYNKLYYVIVNNTIENAALEKQGFKVKVTFSTDPDSPDTDGDGLTDAEEAELAVQDPAKYGCLDPGNPDSDGDLFSDGVEFRSGSLPCVNDPSQLVTYVDDDGASPEWPSAVPLPAAPAPGSADKPHMVLIAEGVYPTNINLSGGCDYISYIGSLDPSDPGQKPVKLADGSPATVIDMNGLPLGSEASACTDIKFVDMHFTNGIGVPAGGGTGGGGIRVSGGTTATFERVWLSNGVVNEQGGGLGVSNAGTVATVRDSVLKNNRVTGGKGGGGIWVGAGATLDMSNTRLINNQATSDGGGGLYVDPASTSTVNNSVISGNAVFGAFGNGGGVYMLGGATLDISDTIISGNYSDNNGGGMHFDTANVGSTFLNLLLTNNYASGQGGAVGIDNSTVDLRNMTAAYNQSGLAGGAITSDGAGNVQDSMFWRNRQGDNTLVTAPAAGDTFNVVAPGWSSFNVLESPDANVANNDIDISASTPGFENGFYLVQVLNPAVSPAFDSGSGNVPGLAGLNLDQKFTDKDGSPDAATLDRGFHYLERSAGTPDGVVLIVPAMGNNLTAGAATPEAVVVEPLTGLQSLGAGQEVIFTVQSAPAGLALVPVADLEPNGAGSAVGTDIGLGQYQIMVDTSSSLTGTLLLDVAVNGSLVGTVSIDVL